MTTPVITKLDDIEKAISDDKLFMVAAADAVESMMRFAVVGHSVAAAIRRLDQVRREFDERAKP